jgi:hypothetical protein
LTVSAAAFIEHDVADAKQPTAVHRADRKGIRERRPLWQRIALPVVGAGMILFGVFGLAVPIIPGILLFAAGFPLLFCFHQTSEEWATGVVRNCYGRLKRLSVRKARPSKQGGPPG